MLPYAFDLVTQAETLWALEVASNDYSFATCDGKKELFPKMFPGDVSSNFTMSKGKVSYLISDGLGPYFRKHLCDDITKQESGYILMMRLQRVSAASTGHTCSLLLRGEGVSVNFQKAEMFGHARGKDVGAKIWSTIEKEFRLPQSKLLGLSSDGPNVNKTVWK